MFALRRPKQLSDLLPWAAIVAPGVVLQKDGILQSSFAFRGPDLQTASAAEVNYSNEQIHNALRRLPGGWAVHCEAQRYVSSAYPRGSFQNAAARIVDRERERFFTEVPHFDSSYCLTFSQALPDDPRAALTGFFFEEPKPAKGGARVSRSKLSKQVEAFRAEVSSTVELLRAAMAIEPLSNDQTLGYLHNCVSPHRHGIVTPKIPMCLDAIVADVPYTAGTTPTLGDHHVLTCTINDFPPSTVPGILDSLNRLAVDYRWVTRYIALDRFAAQERIESLRGKWFGSSKKLRDVAAPDEGSHMRENLGAAGKVAEMQEALVHLSNDTTAFGLFTTTITVTDRDLPKAREKMQQVVQAIRARGFSVIEETHNSSQAWLGSLPGNVSANCRRPPVATWTLAHMIPSTAVWRGEPVNQHLAAVTEGRTGKRVSTAHVVCSTTGQAQFHMSLNAKGDDLGNCFIAGPPGSGKSSLSALLGLQWLKYPDAQVVIFDKDRSARAATLGVGGTIYEPGEETARARFQPLARIDEQSERLWAGLFVEQIFALQGLDVDMGARKTIAQCLEMLATSPRHLRTMTGLAHALKSYSPKFAQALHAYCDGGPFGFLFDGNAEDVKPSAWTMFEMGHLMKLGDTAVLPALEYLFHKVEGLFTGAPTLLLLDECWLFLQHPMFRGKIDEWLRTLRKFNVFVVLLTQQVSDAAKSPLAATINENCPTKIFLASPTAAANEENAAPYRAFGLSEAEILGLSQLRRKAEYYFKSQDGGRVFDLNLGPAALAFCGASRKDDHAFMDRMVRECRPEDYARAMLARRGVSWAVAELAA